jgi:hypothetical protein
MKKSDDLSLYECALLLALRDKEGTIPAGTSYHFALGGGILAELLLRGDVASETEGKKDWIVPKHEKRIADPILNECLDLVRKSTKRKDAAHWVSKFSGLKRLKHRVAEQLCARGILRAADDRVLLVFNRKVYPEVDGGPEAQLIEKIRKAVLTDTQALDAKTVVLIALSRHSDLLRTALDKKEIKSRKARIDQILKGEILEKAVKQAVQRMHAAIVCAAIVPVICS